VIALSTRVTSQAFVVVFAGERHDRLVRALPLVQVAANGVEVLDGAFVQQLDCVLNLLGQAQQHYLASPDQARRYLNQAVFERIYIDDDEVIGADLMPVLQRIMHEDLGRVLVAEQRTHQKHNVRTGDLYLVPDRTGLSELATDEGRRLPAWSRREQAIRVGDFVGLERPRGRLPWEQKNLHPFKDTGSNVDILVALSYLYLNPAPHLVCMGEKAEATESSRYAPPPGPRRTRVTAALKAEVVDRYQGG
jgi:hypothetical protein